MKQSLVIMAAGLGSRFGGIKQLTPVGPGGEIIMEYSIYDAMAAGFNKVIFIIRKDIEEDFKEIIGNRIADYIETDYVFQDLDDLPTGYHKPSDRTKPWGTGQAVLACKDKIDGPFCVINADDYYGKEGFRKIYQFLSQESNSQKYPFCMAGFKLGNTLSEFGGVTRGVCKVDSTGMLQDICETSNITKGASGAFIDDGNQTPISFDNIVSMNMWGFTVDLINELETRFKDFLDNIDDNPLKAEYLLPAVVGDLVKEQVCEVTVLETEDKWFGVTYQEDKPFVIESFQKLTDLGEYPVRLFKNKS